MPIFKKKKSVKALNVLYVENFVNIIGSIVHKTMFRCIRLTNND